LGAYILSSFHNDIASFEERVGAHHSLYTYNAMLGEPICEFFLLEVIAKFRTPNIVLNPHDILNPFNLAKIEELAEYLALFRVPMFLHLFPEARQIGYSPSEYIEFFRASRKIFEKIAPNVIFVFTIYEQDVLDSDVFYPGHDYVDWVGINISASVHENGDPFIPGTLERFRAFYQIYQNYKPIMISSFGVSHFSTINHIYHPQLTGQKISDFYNMLLDHYPRVKAIIYYDVDNVREPTGRNSSDNFSITANQIVLDFYRYVVEDERFIQEVNFEIGVSNAPQLIKSAFSAVKIDNEVLIPLDFVREMGFTERDITYLKIIMDEGVFFYPETLGIEAYVVKGGVVLVF